MSNKSAMEERLIAKFNATLGSDFKELHKSKYLVEGFKQDYVDIQNKVNNNPLIKKIIKFQQKQLFYSWALKVDPILKWRKLLITA